MFGGWITSYAYYSKIETSREWNDREGFLTLAGTGGKKWQEDATPAMTAYPCRAQREKWVRARRGNVADLSEKPLDGGGIFLHVSAFSVGMDRCIVEPGHHTLGPWYEDYEVGPEADTGHKGSWNLGGFPLIKRCCS